MATILDRLQSWLAGQSCLPFVYGSSDCCLVLADWACANGYRDGAVALRGSYSCRVQMEQLLVTSGGALGLVGGCAVVAGLSETPIKQVGTIGVIGSAHNPLRQWGAIWDGSRWQVHWDVGFEGVCAPTLKMWSV